MKGSINHLNLVVSDIQRSVNFYVNKLGFQYIRYLNQNKVILNYGGFDFFLEESSDVTPHPRFHFGIMVDKEGVYEMIQQLRSQEVNIVVGNNPDNLADIYAAPDGVRHVFYFEDPDGYTIEVYSHIGLI